MAIFYDFIKGVTSVNTSVTDKQPWSYIKFNMKDDGQWIPPTIYSANKNLRSIEGAVSGDDLIDRGYITLSTFSNVFDKVNTFSKGIITPSIEIKAATDGLSFKALKKDSTTAFDNLYTFTVNKAIFVKSIECKADIKAENLTINQKAIITNLEVPTGGTAEIRAKVNALSFNSTSDKRAKENIKPVENGGEILDFILNTKLYSFDYKDDIKKDHYIGVMAQDVKDFKINENVSLVENENASGAKGDYMAIKESKLVFVLWAAMQEMAKEIQELKSKLEVR